jgi:serine/threonine protein kinase
MARSLKSSRAAGAHDARATERDPGKLVTSKRRARKRVVTIHDGAKQHSVADRVGSWVLVRRATEGAFSTVYQARAVDAHDAQRAPYAIKLLKPRWHDEPAAVKLLRREARVGRAVSHPHLVPILAAHVHEPPYYAVMPWIEGSTLSAVVAKDNRPELPLALWIVRQTAEALAALDAAGWLHADVKPANIMVSPEGHATLLDLGCARRSHEAGETADGALTGTIAYMAPERLTSALRADIRGDIFSLGVTLFELLTGQLPFDAADMAALARAHRQNEPRDVRQLAPHVPHTVAQLVQQMLAKEPLRRPQTPGELVARLAALEIDSFAEAWE